MTDPITDGQIAEICERAEALPDIRVRGWQKIAADVGKVQVRDDGTSDAIDKWIVSAVHAYNDRRALLARLREAERVMQDPDAVHANMLRGTIAKPSIRQMLHLHGADALARWDGADEARQAGVVLGLRAAASLLGGRAAELLSMDNGHIYAQRLVLEGAAIATITNDPARVAEIARGGEG